VVQHEEVGKKTRGAVGETTQIGDLYSSLGTCGRSAGAEIVNEPTTRRADLRCDHAPHGERRV